MKFVTKSRAKCVSLMLVLSASVITPALADQVSIDSRDFIPVFGNTPYAESGAGNLLCTGDNSVNVFVAQVPLPPTPAELDIKQLAIWGGDITSTDVNVQLDRYCQNEFSASTPVRTNLTSVGSSGAGGNYFDASTLNFRVSDQQTCVYMLTLQLGLNGCTGNLSLARARVRYDLVQAPVVDAMFKDGFEN